MNNITPLDQIRHYLQKTDQVITEGPVPPNVVQILNRENENPTLALNDRKFFQLVEKNTDLLAHEYRTTKHVARKLRDIAQRTLENEKQYNSFERFVHKLQQFFIGHGFRTQGEWLMNLKNNLHNSIIEQNEAINKAVLAFSNPNNSNWVPDADFKKEFNRFSGEMLAEMASKLYKNIHGIRKFWPVLNETNREKIIDEILKRDNWFEMLECMYHNNIPVVNDSVMFKFVQNINMYDQHKNKPFYQFLCNAIV